MRHTKHTFSLPPIFTLILVLSSIFAFAQKPVISSIDKVIAGNQEVISIKGNSFGTDDSKLRVSFGAANGQIIAPVNDGLLQVQVPSGATYGKIGVSNITSGLTDYSQENFLFSFGGPHGFGPAQLQGQRDFDAEKGVYDLCLCDLDGDKRTDIGVASDNSPYITLLKNTTTNPGLANISFNRTNILINRNTLHVTCGDLNGDGKPELVFSQAGDGAYNLIILHNKSTGTGDFTFIQQIIPVTGRQVKRVHISDLDRDGKPELIVTSKDLNQVVIWANQSNPSTISFNATPIIIETKNTIMLDALAVDDLDGDGFPEIVVSQFNIDAGNHLYILRNTSTPGNISFALPFTLAISGSIGNIKIGDLDGDHKQDIVATQVIANTISIFRNTTGSVGALSFASPFVISTVDLPFGLDFGDLDGDQLPDIVVNSIKKPDTGAPSLTILNNVSTPGNLSFQKTVKPVTYVSRHIVIGDIDGDAKPDVAVGSVDFGGETISKISILRNASCQKPEVEPAGPHNICAGFPLKLTTGSNSGTVYEWKNLTTSSTSAGPNAFFDVTVSGNYTVTATSEGGACTLTSNTVSVTVGGADPTIPAVLKTIPPLCTGSTLVLGLDNDPGGTRYEWTGPNGYTSTMLTPDPPTPVSDFRSIKAGRYNLDIMFGSCLAQSVSLVVDEVTVPDFQVIVAGSSIVCAPDTRTLTVSPNPSTYTYKWFERSAPTNVLSSSSSYPVIASGEYFVEAINPSCNVPVTTPGKIITFATAPVADFTLPTPACRGQNLTFTNTSATDASVTPAYKWEFGDTQVSTEVSPVHQYTSSLTTFTVKLTASYSGGACENVRTKSLTVQPAPLATISSPEATFAFCENENLVLEVKGPFTSYSWSTNETTPSITITEPGVYTVQVTTATGCTVDASQVVTVFDSPLVSIQSTPTEIAEGQSAEFEATGLNTYLWEPAETLSSAVIPNPVASPLVTTTYTVRGVDVNGCPGEAVFELGVRAGSIYDKINPSPFFSPDNGDDFGKEWIIEKILDYPNCQVTIYDEKGVKVHEAKPYLNSWDGTFKGRKLPDGVYYFIIKCAGEQKSPKTGSITILR
jgi:gliding motility-associated-like protein